MFKWRRASREKMSDDRFRTYQRAVDAGDINALANLIKEAVRTNTQIYRYAGRIIQNLNDDVLRELEQGGLVNVQYYGRQDAIRHMQRADKVIASLELNLINNEIIKPPSLDHNHLVNASVFWSGVFKCAFLIRGVPLEHIINGTQLGIANITPYFNRSNKDSSKHPQARAILVAGGPPPNTPSDFFGLEKGSISAYTPNDGGAIHPLTTLLVRQTSSYELRAQNTYNAIPLTTKHAEHILGNPNTFDFEAIK